MIYSGIALIVLFFMLRFRFEDVEPEFKPSWFEVIVIPPLWLPALIWCAFCVLMVAWDRRGY